MSPLLQPDTSEAEDFSKPIDEGTYPAKIVIAIPGQSKKDKPKLEVKFKVKVAGKDRTRSSHIPTTGPGSFGLDQLLRAVHMDDLADKYRDPAVNPKPAFDTDSLRDQDLQVVITHQLYKNETTGKEEPRDQISGYLKA